MDDGIRHLITRMEAIEERLPASDARRHFHSTYLRTTRAVQSELATAALGGFVDPPWVEEWDVAFADLYLQPLLAWDAAEPVPGPWASVFRAARERPRLQPLRHVLFGMNVHINFDLPQALLAVITDEQFADPEYRARRSKDHEHIDAVLTARVAAEDRALPGRRTLTDRLLTPFNRRATKRFLPGAREKVWRNAVALSLARQEGPQVLAARREELAGACADRVADLMAPGQVLLKLARAGFGVLLPGA